MGCMTTHEDAPPALSVREESSEPVRSFAVSEDWLAAIVGLILVALILAGVITTDWLPL